MLQRMNLFYVSSKQKYMCCLPMQLLLHLYLLLHTSFSLPFILLCLGDENRDRAATHLFSAFEMKVQAQKMKTRETKKTPQILIT